MLVLGIESSCDETSLSLVLDGKAILSNVVASQVDLHAPFGGVVPELASRRHIELITPLLNEALASANAKITDIDLIAVTYGPGLIGSLLVGINFAKGLAMQLKKPLIGVNHVEAHLISAIMSQEVVPLPAIGLVVSGGHTSLYLIRELFCYELMGKTQDDAIGEAFDKVATLLGLPYPGGPYLEKMAKEGNPHRYRFKVGQIKGHPFDFSFSGLKTGVLYQVRGQNGKEERVISDEEKRDIAASFQWSAFEDIAKKSFLAAKKENCKSIIIGGGVSQNRYLRDLFEQKKEHLRLFFAPPALSCDNGAMIAGAGYHLYLRNKEKIAWPLDAEPRLTL